MSHPFFSQILKLFQVKYIYVHFSNNIAFTKSIFFQRNFFKQCWFINILRQLVVEKSYSSGIFQTRLLRFSRYLSPLKIHTLRKQTRVSVRARLYNSRVSRLSTDSANKVSTARFLKRMQKGAKRMRVHLTSVRRTRPCMRSGAHLPRGLALRYGQ